MKTYISSGSEFEAKIGYSRAVICDGWVFISGTTGYDYANMTLPTSIEAQCENTLKNLQTALAKAGCSFSDVVKVTYIVPHREDFPLIWPQLTKAFGAAPPAATMMVAGLMSEAMKIEIELTARQSIP
jgi:enamine deaminase RidA (YjgF/YER057c/UK114 family)